MNKFYNSKTSLSSQNKREGKLEGDKTGSTILFLTLLTFQVMLTFAMRTSSFVATIHAISTILISVAIAVFAKDTRKAAYAAAYIVGAEVLWRMTDAKIFYESGKYFTVLIFGIVLLRQRKFSDALLPLTYLLLLLASTPLSITSLGLSSTLRSALSFNLSGPLALAISMLFFLQQEFDESTMRRIIKWLILPIFSIATMTLISTMAVAGRITFNNESNFITSGGFGPNQVSAILGLGGGCAILLFIIGGKEIFRWSFLGVSILLLALSALTFSRGGIYNAVVMIILAMIHSIRQKRGSIVIIIGLLIVGLIGGYFVFPKLNAFTGGFLGQRFLDTNTTLRGQIAKTDLEIWLSNPLLGVGPGVSKFSRIQLFNLTDAAHTEYTRILAEHGLAGLFALVIILGAVMRAYLRASTTTAQIWVVSLSSWSLMEMSHAAMRIAAISFLLGLSLVRWKGDKNE